MISEYKVMELTFKRTIPATPAEVYDAWMDPENPGNPWHEAVEKVYEPKLGGLFYFVNQLEVGRRPHYGRFTALERGHRIQQTWMSLYTRGLESTVTVTFEPKGEDTLLTLVHANLPDDEFGAAHEKGWGHFLGLFSGYLETKRG